MCPTCLLFATLAVSLSVASAWFAYRRGHRSGYWEGVKNALAAVAAGDVTIY